MFAIPSFLVVSYFTFRPAFLIAFFNLFLSFDFNPFGHLTVAFFAVLLKACLPMPLFFSALPFMITLLSFEQFANAFLPILFASFPMVTFFNFLDFSNAWSPIVFIFALITHFETWENWYKTAHLFPQKKLFYRKKPVKQPRKTDCKYLSVYAVFIYFQFSANLIMCTFCDPSWDLKMKLIFTF